MRVLLLLPYAWDTAPSQRYRIEQWIPWLSAHGVRFECQALLSRSDQAMLHGEGRMGRKSLMLARCMAQRLAGVASIRGVDAIWLHRAAWPIGPALVERFLASTGIPLIYEFDDAIFLADTARANRAWRFLKFARKTATICGLADHVIVGNDYLAEYARRFNPAVSVIPTTVDTDAYRPRAGYATPGPVTIGWSGSTTTQAHLRLIDRALLRVAREYPIHLRVIGVPDYRLDGVETSAVEWHADRQVDELSRFDVGVMPLPDEEWALGKCACKALEYMAVGVPTVASPIGVNRHLIRDGENGLLATTEDEWVEKILILARDAKARERLGIAGRTTVAGSYSADSQAPRVLEVLRRVARARSVTSSAYTS